MNTERPDFDRALRNWFEDGPTVMSDRVVDDIAARIARKRQKRTWRRLGRPFVETPAKLAIAAAAVLVVGFMGWQFLPGDVDNGGPGSSPTPIPSIEPTPTPAVAQSQTPVACEDDLAGCAGPLAAGAHQSAQFAPPFDFVTGEGWSNTIDLEMIYALNNVPLTTADPILVWSDVVPAEKTAACVLQPKAGVGTTVEAWVGYLTTHPGLVATNVHTASLNGSTAQVLDLRSNATWTSPCEDDIASNSVPIMKSTASSPADGYGVSEDARMRIYVVGVANQTVLVTIYSYQGGDAAFPAVVALADPVVASFSWACKDDSPPGPCWGVPDASGNPATPPPGS